MEKLPLCPQAFSPRTSGFLHKYHSTNAPYIHSATVDALISERFAVSFNSRLFYFYTYRWHKNGRHFNNDVTVIKWTCNLFLSKTWYSHIRHRMDHPIIPTFPKQFPILLFRLLQHSLIFKVRYPVVKDIRTGKQLSITTFFRYWFYFTTCFGFFFEARNSTQRPSRPSSLT